MELISEMKKCKTVADCHEIATMDDLTPKIRTHYYEHRFANSNINGAW